MSGSVFATPVALTYCITPSGMGDAYGTFTANVTPAFNDGSTSVVSSVHVLVSPGSGVYVPTLYGLLQFFDVYVGQSYSAGFQVINFNSSPVTINSITTGSTALTVDTTRGLDVGSRIPGNGGSGFIYITYLPTGSGAISGNVQVTTTGGSVQVPYTGSGKDIVISTSSSGNGTITQSTVVNNHDSLSIVLTPSFGYTLDKLYVDDVDVTSFVAPEYGQKAFLYRLNNITASHSVHVNFKVGAFPTDAQVPAVPPLAGILMALALFALATRKVREQNF